VESLSLPNFLVVGANRAGTTALYSCLSQHPDIYMSQLKEPSFFVLYGGRPDPSRWDNGLFKDVMVHSFTAYRALFAGASGHKAIGEASTGYLTHPAAPARIKSHLPGARVLAILRNPVDRAFSNYVQYRALQLERGRSFRVILGRRPEWSQGPGRFGHRYVVLGYYARAVRRYYETFGRDRVRIYLYEDWAARPREVLADIFRFLEVDNSFIPDVSQRHNESIVPRSRVLAARLDRYWPPEGDVRTAAVARWLRAWNRRPMRLTPTDRRALVEVYREDVLELQQLLDRDLSAWLRS
jgi:sulfotransferase family protein